MTEQNVFDFSDYKAYLRNIEQSRSSFQRGFRSRLSEEISCQNAFVSQVLNSRANFGLEQALVISRYLKHGEDERQYFLWLVELARAGSEDLRDHFRTLLAKLREKFLNIKERVGASPSLSAEAQTTYYSHWYYAAIHVLVTIPKFQTVAAISSALGLQVAVVEKAVIFLISSGLLIEKAGRVIVGPSQLHLDRDSPNISKHHANWRITAINSLAKNSSSDIHYSTVSSLSEKDVELIRTRLVEEIQKYVATVKDSKEETLYCFNLDFFKMLG